MLSPIWIIKLDINRNNISILLQAHTVYIPKTVVVENVTGNESLPTDAIEAVYATTEVEFVRSIQYR